MFKVCNHSFYGIPNSQGGEFSVKQEFNENGSHRIDVGGVVSDPTPYQGIAFVETPQGCFAGVSDYYKSTLPPVFQIIKPVGDY